ncbi:hypothetical protein GCM10010446_01970 [Streptomyces enissocaesilis]|uniref:UbiC transcription regulator-associated domain-containing protein n=1 Tax=Streptomyces enissocaesilis TaxID=332589 RepID=A0ABN3WM97_9ACTN
MWYQHPIVTRRREPGAAASCSFGTGGEAIELDRIEELVIARPPTPEEAEELELPPGTAVVVLRETSYDTDNRAVEISDVTLPGDRTEMLFTPPLERW